MKLSPKELDDHLAKFREEEEAKLMKLRDSLHEFFLLETKGHNVHPHTAVMAVIEHAALLAATYANGNAEREAVAVGYFLQVYGSSAQCDAIAQVGANILKGASNAPKRSERSN